MRNSREEDSKYGKKDLRPNQVEKQDSKVRRLSNRECRAHRHAERRVLLEAKIVEMGVLKREELGEGTKSTVSNRGLAEGGVKLLRL